MGVSGKTNVSRDRYSEDQWSNSDQNTNRNTATNSNSNTNTSSQANTNATSQQNDLLRSLTNSQNNTLNQTTGKTSASFDSPQAQSILNSLTGQATGGPNYTQQAGQTYGRLAQGGVDPNVENIIKASDTEANKNFAGRLAETRAGAYRGGTAANIGKQGQLAADFSAQQAGNNAKTRSDAYNNANTLALGGASGLGSLGQQQSGLGTQLLALLRGEATSGLASGQQTGSTSTDQQNQSNNVSNQATNNTGNSNTSTQTTEQMIQTIIEALTGGKSGTKSGVNQNVSGGFGVNYG